MDNIPVGVALYTIRDQLRRDFRGSLEKVHQIGYEAIELFERPVDISISDQRQIYEHLGLQVIGMHAPFNATDFDMEKTADYLQQIGGKYIAISMKFDSKEDVSKKIYQLNQLGWRAQKHGVQVLYHNHNWEFEVIDGKYILDVLVHGTDPDVIKIELDTYWVHHGGENPARYMKKLGERCAILHIKDMEPGSEQFFAEIGTGLLNFSEIISVADNIGVRWMIVEQDASRRDPFNSLEISYENLKTLRNDHPYT